ncbi:MAG: hypothetical protein QOG72_1672 [Sphingomonadales bacterium]|nr:hypothetical protein [Sphingomonadales bacterium]
MKAAIFIPVVEIRSDAVTYHHPQAVVESDVTSIKHAVDIAPKQQPVRHFVLPAVAVGSNVRRVQGGKDATA